MRTITIDDFTKRFVAHALKRIRPENHDGYLGFLATIADEYWKDRSFDESTPEECGDIDMDYWEPDEGYVDSEIELA